jgi:hypothetical protein
MRYSEDAVRLAHRWMRTAGKKNPFLDPKGLAIALAYHDKIHDLITFMEKSERPALQAIYDAETVEEDARVKWVAEGNHPDDFTDERINPDGYAMREAVRLHDGIHQEMKGGPRNLLSILKSMDKWMEKDLRGQR